MNFTTHINNENAHVTPCPEPKKKTFKEVMATFRPHPTPGSLAEKFALRDAANRAHQVKPYASLTPRVDVDRAATNAIEKVAEVEAKKDEEEEEDATIGEREEKENKKREKKEKREKREKREKQISTKKKRDVASLNTSETKDAHQPLRIKRRKDVRESIGISASVGKRASISARVVNNRDDDVDALWKRNTNDDEIVANTLRACFDAINARLDRIEQENARAGSLILDAIEALGERVQENYDKIEDVDRKVFVIMEQRREEQEKRECKLKHHGVVASAKQAAHHAKVKDESKETIGDGINPEVYLGKTFKNCSSLSQFLVGFERRERVPIAIRPLLSASSLSCCTSYVHNYQKIVKHIRSVIRAFDSKFLDKSEDYDEFLSAAHSAIQKVFAKTAMTTKTKKRATWHAAVKIYLAAADEDERGVIEFEWNLRGAVQKAYEQMREREV
jgi:hypothetical protein